jgi:D-xylose transport system ATP-binding protein
VLILDEPTQGIDVGAKHEVYKLISEATARGVAVLLISSELPELLGLSDRVAVVQEGKITEFLDTQNLNEIELLKRISVTTIGNEE